MTRVKLLWFYYHSNNDSVGGRNAILRVGDGSQEYMSSCWPQCRSFPRFVLQPVLLDSIRKENEVHTVRVSFRRWYLNESLARDAAAAGES